MEIETLSGALTRNCLKCAAENSASAKFCKTCGFNLHTAAAIFQQVEIPSGSVCTQCNTTNTFNARFCKVCGTATAEVPVAPLAATPDDSAAPRVTTHTAAVPISSTLARPPAPSVPPSPVMKQARPLLSQAASTPALESSVPTQAPVLDPARTEAVSINSVSKPAKINQYLVWGSALAVVLALAGAYWFYSSGNRPADKLTAAPLNPAASASAPMPVAVPASASSAAALVAPRAETGPEKTPAPQPSARKIDAGLNSSALQNKRKAEDATVKNRVDRDKAKLNNTNRTLDDLLK